MPHELVTKGSRFYCVCTTPDICKTPIGCATPPIPYMIKGEFSDATGVSRDIRSNGEPVVISDSTVIPAVTGDEAGTAKGIKSGTVGKRVQHDQRSSTVSFNGERAIREGDSVFMNDKNTRGKVLRRGGGGGGLSPSPLAKRVPAANDVPQSAIEAGTAWVDDQTRIDEMTLMKQRYRDGVHWFFASNKDGANAIGIGEILALEKDLIDEAIDFIPESLLDLVPAKKIKVLKKLATKSINAVKRITKAGKADTGAVKGVPPSKGTDGGKSLGKGKKEKNDKPSDCCPKNAGPAGKRTSSKHPVHFGTGEEVLRQTDFALGGAIPIVWARCYRSGSETQDWSILGARWASPFTAHLSLSRKGVVYHDDTGRALRLPVIEPGADFDHRGESFTLSRPDPRHFTLTWRDGSRDHFKLAGMGWLPHGYQGVNAMLPPQQAEFCESYALYRSEDAAGRGLTIERFDVPTEPVLMRIATDDGRVVEAMRKPRMRNVEADLVSHVDEVRANGKRVCHVQYEYATDPAGPAIPARRYDLVGQTDRGGASRHYRYRAHLLTAYTTYGGFEHRLEWISLAALRARWAGSTLADRALAKLHPITVDNSYQARATATRTADGRDEVTIDYLDEDTTRVTEPSGTVFEYAFDDNWLAVDVGVVPPGGGRPQSLGQRVWDSDGMLLEETDALFNTRRYRYDVAGNLVANTDAEGHTTLLDYDGQNRPTRITDALGNVTTYEYDDAGNPVAVTNALGHATRFEYDKSGRICVQIDAKGNRTVFGYDTAGRLANLTDCSGYRSYYRYDTDDNLVATLDALEQQTAYTRDAWGQVTTITHPDGTQEHYAYDAEGNTIRHTDALGHQTHYRYDGHGMPVEQINALGHSVQYRYDAALRLVELINGNGESYRFSYTPEGWLASETTYEGKVTDYRYDRAGQLIAYESCGVAITLERDRMGRLLLKTTPDGLTRYQYDALGRLHAVTAPHAENGFVYDAIGQLLEEHSAYFISEPRPEAYRLRRVPDHYFVMRYAYDELGNRIQTVLPDGHRIDVLRYGSGHWHGVLWDGEPVVDVERDRLHRERKRQFGAPSTNLVSTRTYDELSRITSIALTGQVGLSKIHLLRKQQFAYDATGNTLRVRHGISDDNILQRLSTYVYDGARQLVNATHAGAEEIFTFDAAGTLIATRTSLQSNSYWNGPQSFVKHADLRQWDRLGNLRHKQLTPGENFSLDFTYSSESLLTNSARLSSHSSTYVDYYYDSFARRIAKKVRHHDAVPNVGAKQAPGSPSELTIFNWSGENLSRVSAPGRTEIFIHEPDSYTPLAVEVSVKRSFTSDYAKMLLTFHCEPSGKPMHLLYDTGELAWDELSMAWGKSTQRRNKDPERESNNVRFPGQYEDPETGLHYNRHRYYDPDNGQFITSDPIGILGGTNLYQYAPNPITWSDPLGLAKCSKNNSCNPCDGRDPASAARAWQGPGNAPYLGQDVYQNVVVSKGTVLYTLYPHGGAPGNYFADSKTVLMGATARGYNDALQTAHKGNWKDPRARPMRTHIHAYVLEKDLCMAKGLAANNKNLGNGGGTQYFIENQDKRHLIDTSKIVKFSR